MADMKFSFKIQKYQTDAVKAVCDVFEGQPFAESVKYIRDIGKFANQQKETLDLGIVEDDEYDPYDAASFKNNPLQISRDTLMENIVDVQGNFQAFLYRQYLVWFYYFNLTTFSFNSPLIVGSIFD